MKQNIRSLKYIYIYIYIATISMDRIYRKMGQKIILDILESPAQRSIDPQLEFGMGQNRQRALSNFFELLASKPASCLVRVGDTIPFQYRISICDILKAIQSRLIQSIIEERYGLSAWRIFNIIQEKKQIDEQKVLF